MQNALNLVVKLTVYLLAFLTPLFFLPFSFEIFEFNKQYLLFFLVSLGFLAWLVKMIVYDKEIRFKQSPLDIFVLGFLAVGVLSSIFSLDRGTSLFGFYGRFSNGLLGLLSLGALYFLITNNVQYEENASPKEKHSPVLASKLLKLFLWAGFLVVLAGYFSVFGIWAKLAGFLPLPQVMLQKTFNPVAGSLEGLAIFLAVLAVLLTGKFLVGEEKKKTKAFLLIASLGLMIVIDYTMSWIVLLASLLLVAGVSIWKRLFKENVNRLLLPILLIIVSAALVFYNPSLMNLPKEQVLNQPLSWQVSFNSATDSVKNGFLGSGPGTFYHDFAKNKPLEINKSWFWQIRFDRAGSHVAEILATMGFLGILSYLSVIAIFLLISWFMLRGGPDAKLPLLMAFAALIASQFVYYQNTVLAFSFWLFLGLAVVSWQKPIQEKVVSFKNFPELSLVLSTVIIVFSVALAATYFFGAKYYLADANYLKALYATDEKKVENMEKAVRLNPGSAFYRTVLARIYLGSVLTEAAKPANQQNLQKIQLRVAGAIDQAKIASDLQPSSVANWETLGIIYREIKGIVSGATEWGIKSFEEAIKLEPTNPVLYTELGKMYAGAGQTEKAKENFQKAIDKKSDYSDALIQQALFLEKESIVKEAIAKLEQLVISNPFHIEGLFQLGRLYFNDGKINEAIELFKRVVLLEPGHSNAHYSLAVAFAAKGDKASAIEEFQRVLDLNPGNQDIIQKLSQLRGQ